MNAQDILEGLGILPELAWVTDLHHQLTAPMAERTGFMHSNGEWNLLYKYNGAMYRLPASMAEVRLGKQRNFH